ncbi:MAG: MBL fold metallo-hydrolase, partial [Verrucomicrobiota bacterium]
HNDHTAAIAEAARHFDCGVYAIEEVAEVIENPGDWFLPGVSGNAVDSIRRVGDREVMQWEEFQFTFYFFPGQMYNHGAMLVEKPGHAPVFFIGDSFSPSGIDDYCMMNRNLMREDTGYELCFEIISGLPEATWLVNQHIPHLFRFSEEERNFLLSRYRERADLIRDFVTWDDINFAIDEQWAAFHPYGQTASPGQTVKAEVRIWNHSRKAQEYKVKLQHREIETGESKIVAIDARENAVLSFQFELPQSDHQQYVITASIQRGDGRVEDAFCETLIRVGDPKTLTTAEE